jgi:hypothetical protein
MEEGNTVGVKLLVSTVDYWLIMTLKMRVTSIGLCYFAGT